ncbi:MAG TPA: hypothetical protein VFX25_14985, partial [Streptosporangiaceae bacterium]|nr:hypothetical protein [Streptosporangiaceae bacterium]
MESTGHGPRARVLLAWLSDGQARTALAGAGRAGEDTAAGDARLAAARAALASRPAGPDQAGLIRPLPGELGGYA